jgi:uncharacterized protein YbjT (DUF2867 family)
MSATKVLVIGATGRQGGAVARRLAASGKAVRALTRSPDSPAARELAAHGVELVTGDLRDPASLRRALAGMDAAFAMTVATDDPEDEVAQGTAVVEAADATGLPRLVFSSAALADQHTGIPSIEAKAVIEARVLAASAANVVLAPAGFFEMVLSPESLAGIASGVLVDGLPADLPIPALGLDDYARMVDAVLDDPGTLPARRVDLACDAPTRAAMADAVGAAIGRPVGYHRLPLPAVQEISEHWHRILEWMIRTEPEVDVTLPGRIWPGRPWRTFAQWAATPEVAGRLAAPLGEGAAARG